MRLLVTTQAVDLNDPILGFFHQWILALSKECESVDVICLRAGSYSLPQNVRIHSLGKENGVGRIGRTLRFLYLALVLSGRNDAVFAHMNPEYVALMGWYWKLRGLRISLWYVHKSVTWWLRFAARFVDYIFTAVPESIAIQSDRIRVMGHGIDVDALPYTSAPLMESLDMRTIGRISQSKGIDTALDICELLEAGAQNFSLTIIGSPVTDEEARFAERMYDRAARASYAPRVRFAGPVRNTNVAHALTGSNMFLNISHTGGLDKSVLEAALLGIPVVSTNPTFRSLLAGHGLFVESATASEVLRAIETFRARPHAEQERVLADVAAHVQRTHALQSLIPAIVKTLSI